jgi:hypothetical protein
MSGTNGRQGDAEIQPIVLIPPQGRREIQPRIFERRVEQRIRRKARDREESEEGTSQAQTLHSKGARSAARSREEHAIHSLSESPRTYCIALQCQATRASHQSRARRLPLSSDIIYFASQSYILRRGRYRERSLQSSVQFLAQACTRDRVLAAAQGCIPLLAVAIGVLGLLGASWPRQMLESWINIHALFGLLLAGWVFSRYRSPLTHPPRLLPADIHRLSRHLSRIVYLLLFLVIGVTEIIGMVGGLRHGGEMGRNTGYPGFDPTDDFQWFFASGLFALVVVRVLAFALQRSSRK